MKHLGVENALYHCGEERAVTTAGFEHPYLAKARLLRNKAAQVEHELHDFRPCVDRPYLVWGLVSVPQRTPIIRKQVNAHFGSRASKKVEVVTLDKLSKADFG